MKKNKIKLNIALVLIAVLYVPFFIFLVMRYDAINNSLSAIGWQQNGLIFLLAYVFYTVPLTLFLTFGFMKLSNKKSKLLLSASIIGGTLMIIGAVVPVKEGGPQIFHILHSALCQVGSVLLILTVTYMIAIYCKENKASVKKVAILYGELIAMVAVGFAVLYTAAIFEVVASVLFLITILIINISLLSKAKGAQNEIHGVYGTDMGTAEAEA